MNFVLTWFSSKRCHSSLCFDLALSKLGSLLPEVKNPQFSMKSWSVDILIVSLHFSAVFEVFTVLKGQDCSLYRPHLAFMSWEARLSLSLSCSFVGLPSLYTRGKQQLWSMIPPCSPASHVHSLADSRWWTWGTFTTTQKTSVLTLIHLCSALRPNVQYPNLNHFWSAVYGVLLLRDYESLYY